MTASQMPLDQPVGAAGPTTDVPDEPAARPSGEIEESPEEKKRRRRRVIFLLLLLGLLAFLIGLVIWYLLFRQPLPPLPVIPESQVPSYSTSLYGATDPIGIAVTPEGDRIYVAESGGDKGVAIFDAGGNRIGTATPPAETGAEHLPVYVAIDPLTEEVYVTDRPTGSIFIYDRDGRYQRTFSPAEPVPGWQPMGIAFGADGLMFVTVLSGASPSVQVFDRTGTVVRTFGEADALSFPNGIAIDAAGNAYVTDSNNGRLLVYDTSGAIISRVGRGSSAGNLGLPRGVVLDSKARVFVVDTTGQGVSVYKTPASDQASPDHLGRFGDQGVGDGQFQYPNGVAVDGRQRVYVTDTGNDRVQVWSY